MDEETIVAEALEKPPEEREDFLTQACGDDPKLRTQVELRLRAEGDAAGSQADGGPGTDPTVDSADDSGDFKHEPVSLDFLRPSETEGHLGVFGPYEVLQVIGAGGMGVVLRAVDPRLNRVVALKVLAPTLASNATARGRFEREARAAASVSHEHVVTIHSVDEFDGLPCLVMEYVPGPSLHEKIAAGGPLPVKEVLRIGRQIAAGLAAAHAKGLVHRDIKPANILLEEGAERVKITDFGLARAVDDASVTKTGQVTGTPQFMSPEQAEGRTVDHRTDLFSLGSVLYTMCVGRPPFAADSMLGVMRRVCEEDPAPISEANPEIPHWLEVIVGKLQAKEPDDRFQSAQGVADLLGRHLAHVRNPKAAPRPRAIQAPPKNRPRERDVPTPVGEERPSWLPTAVFALVLLVFVGAVGAVVHFATDNGQLILDSAVDGAGVTVLRDGEEVVILDLQAGERTVRLPSGVYDIRLRGGGEGVHLSTDRFVITRGGQAIVWIENGAAPGQ